MTTTGYGRTMRLQKSPIVHCVEESSVGNTSPNPFQSLDFNDLSLLAMADPAKFEELRTALIERVINIPGGNPDRLAALQSRLTEAMGSGTPRYISCLHLSEWLDEPFQRLNQLLSTGD
ncbi:MAG: DUF3135 domain-containing protein [Rhodocyclaceae bacterium]